MSQCDRVEMASEKITPGGGKSTAGDEGSRGRVGRGGFVGSSVVVVAVVVFATNMIIVTYRRHSHHCFW